MTSIFEDLIAENSELVADALSKLQNRVWWLETRMDRLQQALDFVIPRFDQFFRYESDARAAWEPFCTALGEPGRPFPRDASDAERGDPNFFSREAAT